MSNPSLEDPIVSVEPPLSDTSKISCRFYHFTLRRVAPDIFPGPPFQLLKHVTMYDASGFIEDHLRLRCMEEILHM